MKKFVIVFIVLISFCLSAQQKHRTAILNYEDRSGKIEAETLSTATEYLRMYFEGQNTYSIIPKEEQDKVAATCKDKLCRIKFGETLKAAMVVYPYVTFANEQFIIKVEIIDVAKRSTTISVSENWDGGTDSLDPLSETIVRKIAAKQKNIDALNANSSFRENIPQEEPTFAETFKVVYNTVRDTQDCEKAREKENLKLWKKYLKSFPEGQCAEEAKKFIEEYPKKQDAEACEKARKENDKKEWEKYLKEHPEGQCAEEAKAAPDNIACEKARKENDKKEWEKYLKEFPNGLCAEEAKAAPDSIACEKAKKDHSPEGWKKYLNDYPNGKCADYAKNFFADGAKKRDTNACQNARNARETRKKDAWEKYLKEFPDGQCAEEAKILLDKDACEEAKALPEKIKKRAWEKYLKEFPDGQCAEEAKKFLEN
ncbi:hypothetical protein J5690_08330 [bacterium]|nr:hypothetical protein [bacterium]